MVAILKVALAVLALAGTGSCSISCWAGDYTNFELVDGCSYCKSRFNHRTDTSLFYGVALDDGKTEPDFRGKSFEDQFASCGWVTLEDGELVEECVCTGFACNRPVLPSTVTTARDALLAKFDTKIGMGKQM